MKRIAIVGSRSIDNLELLEEIWNLLNMPFDNVAIISGGATGVDTNAREFANKHNLEIKEFKPNWYKYGKRAGFKRNEDIIKNCDICIAIWDGKSPGTEHSISLCKAYFKRLYVWNNSPGFKKIFTYKYENTQLEIF